MPKSKPKKRDIAPLLEQLKERHSAKRRSAAKGLRQIGDPKTCEILIEALKSELRNQRTWETLYQMIMALGECECRQALPLAQELAKHPFYHTTILLAVGEALVRLGRKFAHDPSPVIQILAHASDYHDLLVQGVLRAVAALKLQFEPEVVKEIISRALELKNDGAIFWTAAACPGWNWKDESIRRFL
jgi:HEAT repeat protein